MTLVTSAVTSVRRQVTELLMDELRSTVIGVQVKKASGAMVQVRAPMVISNAGSYHFITISYHLTPRLLVISRGGDDGAMD